MRLVQGEASGARTLSVEDKRMLSLKGNFLYVGVHARSWSKVARPYRQCSKPLFSKEKVRNSDRKHLYSGHAVIALAILGAVIVAICASPDVAVAVASALARVAQAVASSLKP